jgi:predicted phosphodiesterase
MKILRREIEVKSRSDVFHLYPIGDIHIGSINTDEERLKKLVKEVEKDKFAYWIGQGDFAEFINRCDKRFDPMSLAKWISVEDTVDICHAQIEHLLHIMKPIASKCLTMVEGNHERTIKHHFERDVFSEIVTRTKTDGGFPSDYKLSLGDCGWLQLIFKRQSAITTLKLYCHHGYGSSSSAAGKATEAVRFMASHDADLTLFGHGHNIQPIVMAIEGIDGAGNLVQRKRYAVYTGSFMRHIEGYSDYAEVAGKSPLPVGGVRIDIRPGAADPDDIIHIVV